MKSALKKINTLVKIEKVGNLLEVNIQCVCFGFNSSEEWVITNLTKDTYEKIFSTIPKYIIKTHGIYGLIYSDKLKFIELVRIKTQKLTKNILLAFCSIYLGDETLSSKSQQFTKVKRYLFLYPAN
jgi:hypothetical protein